MMIRSGLHVGVAALLLGEVAAVRVQVSDDMREVKCPWVDKVGDDWKCGNGPASCFSSPHSWVNMGNPSRCIPGKGWEEVVRGCGFQERSGSGHSRKPAVGFGQDGKERSDLELLMGVLPGVGDGEVFKESDSRCPNSLEWDVPEACMRALVADLAPVYAEDRAWTFWKAALPNYWHNGQTWRSTKCWDIVRPRSWIKRKSYLGKNKALCWDFVKDLHDLYCDAVNNKKSRAAYRHICKHTKSSWEQVSNYEKAILFKEADDEFQIRKGGNRTFLTDWARQYVDYQLQDSSNLGENSEDLAEHAMHRY